MLVKKNQENCFIKLRRGTVNSKAFGNAVWKSITVDVP